MNVLWNSSFLTLNFSFGDSNRDSVRGRRNQSGCLFLLDFDGRTVDPAFRHGQPGPHRRPDAPASSAQSRRRALLPRPSQVQIWQSTAGLQRLSRHHEGVQVSELRHPRCHRTGFQSIQGARGAHSWVQHVPASRVQD